MAKRKMGLCPQWSWVWRGQDRHLDESGSRAPQVGQAAWPAPWAVAGVGTVGCAPCPAAATVSRPRPLEEAGVRCHFPRQERDELGLHGSLALGLLMPLTGWMGHSEEQSGGEYSAR